jgi:uroporphyrinogen-III synthase
VKVLLVRPEGAPDDDERALRSAGFHVTSDPFIQVRRCTDPAALSRAHALLAALQREGAWLVLTSAAGARALSDIVGSDVLRYSLSDAAARGTRFAAVGPASAAALADHGIDDVLTPVRAHTASALLEAMAEVPAATAVLPRSSIGDGLTPTTLEARGWTVVSEVVYETTAVPGRPASADALARGEFDAVVLRSPSAARAVHQFAGRLPTSTAVIAGGPTTALAAQRLGFTVAAVSSDSRAASIAAALA